MKQKIEILIDAKRNITEGEVFYQVNGKMVTSMLTPEELIMVTDKKGSLEVYYKEKNTVIRYDNISYSSDNSQLYYFFNNRQSDLGLRQMGFSTINSVRKEGMFIVDWAAPASYKNIMSKVRTVHKAGYPVYMSWFNAEFQEIKKVYYYEYKALGQMQFPQTITQIDYMPNGDSTITRTTYFDIELNTEDDSDLFDFTVPEDAMLFSK